MIHMMLMHVTLVLILAFFVLFAAGKADGFAKLLGTVLGWWLIIVAVLLVVGCIVASMNGGKFLGMDMKASMAAGCITIRG